MAVTWEILYPIGTLLLFLAVAWGFIRVRRRSAREKAITETAAHELYKHPDRYEQGERQALEAEAEAERRRQEDRPD